MSSSPFLRRILTVNLVIIAGTVMHGLLRTGNPSRYFGEHRYTTFISSAQLLTVGIFSFLTFRARRRTLLSGTAARSVAPSPPLPPSGKTSIFHSPVMVWLLMGAGFVFLAVDESAELHERMDRAILRLFDLPRTPLTGRIDDAILGLYGVAGLAVMWGCRRELLPFRGVMLKPLAAGFVCLFIGVMCDTASHDDHFFHWLTGDLPLAKKLNGWFSAAEGAFTLLPEALFMAAFHAAWKKAESGLPETGN